MKHFWLVRIENIGIILNGKNYLTLAVVTINLKQNKTQCCRNNEFEFKVKE